MPQGHLEHVNITVTDPLATANRLCELFDWQIRWHGPSLGDGETVHVGTDNDYIAVYSTGRSGSNGMDTYATAGGLNHIGVVVDDLELVEDRVKAVGYAPHSHADYEPGRRFYYRDEDHIEWEVVSYT